MITDIAFVWARCCGEKRSSRRNSAFLIHQPLKVNKNKKMCGRQIIKNLAFCTATKADSALAQRAR